MGKQKKQNYSNGKGSRKIKKDTSTNAKGKEQFNNRGNTQKDSRKNISYNLYQPYELPPNKARPTHYAPQNIQSNLSLQVNTVFTNSNSTTQKKAQSAKSQQVQQALSQLQALQNLLNGYQNFEVDQKQNIKSLVQCIMQKQVKQQKS